MNKTFVTRSAAETARLAENLGQKINGPVCVVFNGGLGAGKTHFCAGLCRGLGYFGDVTSPTFTIVNEYLGGRLPIFHFDLYAFNSLFNLKIWIFSKYMIILF